ncbi:MAG: hypothetical protein J7501_14970, partial [Bdellovibrio sp.]|nr:hypothetical protein [Bdellovibrio sp.]
MKSKLVIALTLFSLNAFAQKQDLEKASYQFLFSDLGSINRASLDTNTLPAKLTLTGLVLEGRRQGWIASKSTDYKSVLQRFGFYTPSVVMNAPTSLKTNFSVLPMGLIEKDISFGIPGAHSSGMNVSCA